MMLLAKYMDELVDAIDGAMSRGQVNLSMLNSIVYKIFLGFSIVCLHIPAKNCKHESFLGSLLGSNLIKALPPLGSLVQLFW